MRGEHVDDHPVAPRPARFIPACAGNTVYSSTWITSIAVHPRMRGEHSWLTARETESSGSSPHARGTLDFLLADERKFRFIPACAGNTKPAPRSFPALAVHPRMRGEHGGTKTNCELHDGSSPHARGTLDLQVIHA